MSHQNQVRGFFGKNLAFVACHSGMTASVTIAATMSGLLTVRECAVCSCKGFIVADDLQQGAASVSLLSIGVVFLTPEDIDYQYLRGQKTADASFRLQH